MFTPYDWQESIGHRAQYVESRLASGTPVLMVSIPEGVLAFTVRRQARKVFEVYDRLIYSAIGQQSDVESLRVAAIDFTHQEGYQRSEQDVTIQRVVSALSQPLKKAFGDFSVAPFVVRALFAEVCETPEEDRYYVVDYDGDFSLRRGFAYLAPNEDGATAIKDAMAALDPSKWKAAEALEALKPVWARALDPEGDKAFETLTENLSLEAAILRRRTQVESRFRSLTGDEGV